MRRALFIVSLLLLLRAGTWFFSDRTLVSWNKAHTAQLRLVAGFGFPDSPVWLVLEQPMHSVRLAYRRDCIVQFAHAAWRANQVAIYVDGGPCGQFSAAYDLQSRRPLDVPPWLAHSILESYKVAPAELAPHNGDVFAWIRHDPARRANRTFFTRSTLD